MSTNEPTPTLRYNAKRELILDSAARVFNRRGIRGGTLADVAAGVGLVTNSVTYYYRKREDLAEACLLRSVAALAQIVERAAAEQTVADRIGALVQRYAGLMADVEEGRHWPLMYMHEMKALAPPHVDRVIEAYKGVAKTVRGLVVGPETAHLSRAELNARGYLVLSMSQWVRACLVSHEPGDYGLVARRVSDVLLRGVAANEQATWPHLVEDEQAFWSSAQQLPEISDPFLRVGSRLINEHGYRGASIDRIAAELDLTKGAFYGRRETKDDLVAECFNRSFLVQKLAWDRAHALGDTGWARLCIGMRSLLWFQLSDVGPMLRSGATTSMPDDALKQRVRDEMRRSSRRIENLMIEGMMDGSLRPCAQTVAAFMMGCVIDTAAGLSRWERSTDQHNITSLYLKPALFGLLCRG